MQNGRSMLLRTFSLKESKENDWRLLERVDGLIQRPARSRLSLDTYSS
jgi:hypothetical protein